MQRRAFVELATLSALGRSSQSAVGPSVLPSWADRSLRGGQGTNDVFNVRAFGAKGDLLTGWPVDMQTLGACSPGGALLADLDGDGRPEVVRGMSLDEVQAFVAPE